MNEIKLNLDNLTREERAQLIALVHKANRTGGKRYMPEKEDIYYFVDECGICCHSKWFDDTCDNDRFDFNNVFKTEQEAEKVAKQKRVLAKMQIFALEHNDEDLTFAWDADMTKNKLKFYIGYNCANKKFKVHEVCQFVNPFAVYFVSAEIAQACIDELGDELLDAFDLKKV